MAKHKKDAGLQYIQKLHLTQVRSALSMMDEMNRRFGPERTQAYLMSLPEVEDRSYYDSKNADPDLGFYLSAARDSDCIRRSATWIHDHREAFGQEILEIGTDAGLITGFLALEFPDRHIAAIDRSEPSLKVTEGLLKKLGVTNVTLVHADLHDYVKDHSAEADTVVSMRALRENLPADPMGMDLQPMRTAIDLCVPGAFSYAADLTRAVRPQGTLISLLDSELDALLVGWMMDLGAIGWEIDESTLTRIPFTSPMEESVLHAFTARAAEHPDLDALGHPEGSPEREAVNARKQKVTDYFREQFSHISPSATHYSGAEARLLCWMRDAQFLQGVGFFDEYGVLSGKYVLYTPADDPEKVISFYQILDASPAADLYEKEEDIQREMDTLRQVRQRTQSTTTEMMRQMNLHPRWLRCAAGTGMELADE